MTKSSSNVNMVTLPSKKIHKVSKCSDNNMGNIGFMAGKALIS